MSVLFFVSRWSSTWRASVNIVIIINRRWDSSLLFFFFFLFWGLASDHAKNKHISTRPVINSTSIFLANVSIKLGDRYFTTKRVHPSIHHHHKLFVSSQDPIPSTPTLPTFLLLTQQHDDFAGLSSEREGDRDGCVWWLFTGSLTSSSSIIR